MSDFAHIIHEEVIQNFCKNPEREKGNHYFVKYNAGNLICKKCGRFAKVGYMRKGGDNT